MELTHFRAYIVLALFIALFSGSSGSNLVVHEKMTDC